MWSYDDQLTDQQRQRKADKQAREGEEIEKKAKRYYKNGQRAMNACERASEVRDWANDNPETARKFAVGAAVGATAVAAVAAVGFGAVTRPLWRPRRSRGHLGRLVQGKHVCELDEEENMHELEEEHMHELEEEHMHEFEGVRYEPEYQDRGNQYVSRGMSRSRRRHHSRRR